MVRHFVPIVAGLLLIALWFPTLAATQQPICRQVAALWKKGGHERYAIPFDQPDPNELIYHVDIDNDGKVDVIRTLCGNGSDASCEVTATFEENGVVEFSLPATTRFLRIDRTVYIANGVSIDRGGKPRFSDYTVHRLSRDGIELVCDGTR